MNMGLEENLHNNTTFRNSAFKRPRAKSSGKIYLTTEEIENLENLDLSNQAAFVVFCNLDIYLKLYTYILQLNTLATIQLFNGTFDMSENAIARNRIVDASLVGNGKRSSVDNTKWSDQNGIGWLF